MPINDKNASGPKDKTGQKLRLNIERMFFWIGGIGSIVTIASAAISGVAALRKQPLPEGALTALYVTFVITLIAISLYLFLARRRTEANLTRAFSTLHHTLSKTLVCLSTVHMAAQENKTNQVRILDLCKELMSDFEDIFTQLTHHQCATCVKLFVDEELSGQDFVTTYCRDGKSRAARGKDDGEDRWSTDINTAFHEAKIPSNYHFSNNLLKETLYHNDRSAWPERYKSAVVMRIQGIPLYESSNDRRGLGAVGFLCVDSKETNVFRKAETIALMECMADILYLPLHQLRMLQRAEREGGERHG